MYLNGTLRHFMQSPLSRICFDKSGHIEMPLQFEL